MLLADISPTKDDFEQCQWQDVVANSERKECEAYQTLFSTKAKEAEAQGNIKTQEVYTLLYHICSLFLKSNSPNEPFGPMAVFAGRRSAVIDDFNEAQLNVLEDIVAEVRDAELRARIADVLWCRKKGDFQMAQLAVKSYLESAELLEDPQNWVQCFHRIERASQLAISLGKKNAAFIDTIRYIEGVLDKYQGEDPMFLSAKLMEILQEYKEGDPSKYAVLAFPLTTKPITA